MKLRPALKAMVGKGDLGFKRPSKA